MGAKAKKSLKIKLKKQSARLSISKLKNESSDFLKKDQGEKFIKRKRSLFKIHQQCYTLDITRTKWKERTAEEYQQIIRAIVKIDAKLRKRIKAAGIDYECTELVGMQPAAKKIKSDEEED